MNPKNWIIDEDEVLLSSINKIPVPWTHFFMEIWIQLEADKTSRSDTQERALDNFLSLHSLKKFVLLLSEKRKNS